MTKRLIPLFILLCLLGSCAPVPAAPTQAPTATIFPIRTLRPTQTAIPTATPYPPLKTEGPYLLFQIDFNSFTVVDVDGRGRKQFQLPNNGKVYNLKSSISPDGKWLAYFTGSSLKEPYDLALHLFNLKNQTDLFIADLIAPGFPESLAQVKIGNPADFDHCNDDLCRGAVAHLTFHGGIESMDWSPDSQSLAFAAQIDGPSSDVYIFNIEDKSIRRLVNDLENDWFIDWSPTGEKILFQNSWAATDYSPIYFYVADPNIKSIQSPNAIFGGKFWHGEGWINDNTYLIWIGGEGASPNDLRYINVKTQQSKKI